jgi:flagellar hook-associated protein 1 FlgK
MASQFLGLNTGLSGLTYFQAALNTTSHNISNAATEGYSKQTVSGTASNPLDISASYGMMGTGVTATSVDRARSEYYDNKYYVANSKCSRYEASYDKLSELETYMNEMSSDAGYTAWISEMSTSLQDLSDNPSDYTTRISYTLTADSFTDMVNELADNYQTAQKSINDEIELAVSDINSITKQIFELTQQIIAIEVKGGSANDLRDKRNLCLDQLSEYGTVTVDERTMMFGTGVNAVASNAQNMSVYFNGQLLTDEMVCNQLMVVPRNQVVNQNDVEGLVDIYWQCSDGTAGEKFNVAGYSGRLEGLLDVRDGNNGEVFAGTVTSITDSPATATVNLPTDADINTLNIPTQGTITLNGKDYFYDGWTAVYDENGKINNFTFQNMTMYNDKGVEVTATFGDRIVGYSASIGVSNTVKGIPYYQARLNELVRTFSKYMNDLTTSGVDENGEAGLDMYTAQKANGDDYVLKDSMSSSGGILTSSADSYYSLTALNWELSSEWKSDPSKVVVSYAEDVEQGNVENDPIVDAMVTGIQDMSMFQQGTISQYLQSMTTNLGVDIAKMQVFQNNQDDIKYTIDTQRQSISGVDKNEEGSELVKFQNLYNLASKVISILNEVYDKLIEETGV